MTVNPLQGPVDGELDPEDDPNNQGEDEFEEAEDERQQHREPEEEEVVVEEEEEPMAPVQHRDTHLGPEHPAVEEELVVSEKLHQLSIITTICDYSKGED